MAKDKTMTVEQQRKLMAEKLWLLYFNQYLYEKNVITESARNRMILKIESRKTPISDEPTHGQLQM